MLRTGLWSINAIQFHPLTEVEAAALLADDPAGGNLGGAAAAGAVGADDADEDDVVKQLALDLDGPSSWSLTKLSLNEGTEPRLIGQLGVHTASPTGELLRSRLVAVLFFPCGE